MCLVMKGLECPCGRYTSTFCATQLKDLLVTTTSCGMVTIFGRTSSGAELVIQMSVFVMIIERAHTHTLESACYQLAQYEHRKPLDVLPDGFKSRLDIAAEYQVANCKISSCGCIFGCDCVPVISYFM